MALQAILDFVPGDVLRKLGEEAQVKNASSLRRKALVQALLERQHLTLIKLVDSSSLDVLRKAVEEVGITDASSMSREVIAEALEAKVKGIGSTLLGTQDGQSKSHTQNTENKISKENTRGQRSDTDTSTPTCSHVGQGPNPSYVPPSEHYINSEHSTTVVASKANITCIHGSDSTKTFCRQGSVSSSQGVTDEFKGSTIDKVIGLLKEWYMRVMTPSEGVLLKTHLKDKHGNRISAENLLLDRRLRTLVEGPTGSGFSMLFLNLARDWVNREPYMSDISLLIYYNLEELKEGEDLEMAILGTLVQCTIRWSINADEARDLLAQYIAQQENKVLLLLDGFDKLLTESYDSLCRVFNYRQGPQLSCFGCSVKVLTSRDTAAYGYCIDAVDYSFITSVFEKEEQETFVQEALRHYSKDFLRNLNEIQLSDEINRNPKFLSWIVAAFRRNRFRDLSKTDIYELLTKKLSKEYLSKYRGKEGASKRSLVEQIIPEKVMKCAELCYNLCTKDSFQKKKKTIKKNSDFKYRLIVEDEINQYVSQSENKYFKNFGWFKKEMDSGNKRFIFFDKCLLEFLAALYLFAEDKKKNLTNIHEMFFGKVFFFLSGLLKTEAHQVFDIARFNNVPGHVECLYEAGNSDKNKTAFFKNKHYIGVWNPRYELIYEEILKYFSDMNRPAVWEIKQFEENFSERSPNFAIKEESTQRITWRSTCLHVYRDQVDALLQHPTFEHIVRADSLRLLFICNIPQIIPLLMTHDVHLPVRALVFAKVELNEEFLNLLTDVRCKIACKPCGLNVFECKVFVVNNTLTILDAVGHLMQFLKHDMAKHVTVYSPIGEIKIQLNAKNDAHEYIVEHKHFTKQVVEEEGDFRNVESLNELNKANEFVLTVKREQQKNVDVMVFIKQDGYVHEFLSFFMKHE